MRRSLVPLLVRFSVAVRALLLACLLLSPARSHAQIDSGVVGTLERYTLDNGLRVILNPVSEHPTVAICVTYAFGSAHELEGQSGFAHLFEHLMFQGTRNVPPGDHFRL